MHMTSNIMWLQSNLAETINPFALLTQVLVCSLGRSASYVEVPGLVPRSGGLFLSAATSGLDGETFASFDVEVDLFLLFYIQNRQK